MSEFFLAIGVVVLIYFISRIADSIKERKKNRQSEEEGAQQEVFIPARNLRFLRPPVPAKAAISLKKPMPGKLSTAHRIFPRT